MNLSGNKTKLLVVLKYAAIFSACMVLIDILYMSFNGINSMNQLWIAMMHFGLIILIWYFRSRIFSALFLLMLIELWTPTVKWEPFSLDLFNLLMHYLPILGALLLLVVTLLFHSPDHFRRLKEIWISKPQGIEKSREIHKILLGFFIGIGIYKCYTFIFILMYFHLQSFIWIGSFNIILLVFLWALIKKYHSRLIIITVTFFLFIRLMFVILNGDTFFPSSSFNLNLVIFWSLEILLLITTIRLAILVKPNACKELDKR